MFRSRLTLEQYISSLQNDAASLDDPSLDDLGDQIQFEEDETDNNNNADIHTELDPSLITIPSDFNDRHEILVIDGEGNASQFKGKITTSSVHTLDYPKRILVPLNQYLQPVKKAGSLFNRFLANVSRRLNLCPLDYKEWRVVTNLKEKENMISSFQLPSSGDHVKLKFKERERELRKRKEREEQEMERIRLQFHRKEVVASYQALLVETIKDPQASWTVSKPKLEKDPQGRASNPDLDEAHLEKLFHEHVKMLNKVNNLKRIALQNNEERNKSEVHERSDETQGTHYQATDVFVEKKRSALESSSKQVGAKRHLVKEKVNLSAAEIESVVDKVMKENMSFVQKYRHGTRQEFIACYLTGMVVAHVLNVEVELIMCLLMRFF